MISSNILIALGIGVVLATAWLTQAVPDAEAASAKTRKAQIQKGSGNDKGVAWVSGAGGVRGYAKGSKVRTKPKAKGGIRRGTWIMDVGRE